MKKWLKRIGLGALCVAGLALLVKYAHKIPTFFAGAIILPILLFMTASSETRTI